MFNSKQLDTQTAYLQGNTEFEQELWAQKRKNRLKLNLIHSIIQELDLLIPMTSNNNHKKKISIFFFLFFFSKMPEVVLLSFSLELRQFFTGPVILHIASIVQPDRFDVLFCLFDFLLPW